MGETQVTLVQLCLTVSQHLRERDGDWLLRWMSGPCVIRTSLLIGPSR